jgi:hypothetical protein
MPAASNSMPMPSYAKFVPDTNQLGPVRAQCTAPPAGSGWPEKTKKVIEEEDKRRCRHKIIYEKAKRATGFLIFLGGRGVNPQPPKLTVSKGGSCHVSNVLLGHLP